jgi:hypothetical protein
VPDALRVMGRGDGRGAAVLGKLVERRDAPPLRLAIWHGDADHTVNAANAQDLTRQWTCALGLAEAPSEVVRLAGRTRSTWRGDTLDDGSIVELNIVHGLGHGTPLSTLGEGDVGSPAPYMLEAGLSSTLATADFWGLSTTEATTASPVPPPIIAPPLTAPPTAEPGPAPDDRPTGVAAQVLDAISDHVPSPVRDVIAKALRSAGLMR